MKKKTLEENGRQRGKELIEKYGPDHFSKMGKRGIAKQKEQDPEIFKKRGKAGANARQKKDPRYMEKMRRKRWKKQPTTLDILLDR